MTAHPHAMLNELRTTAYLANSAASSAGYTPLPVGEYEMEIVESDYDINRAGDGMVLKCKAQVVGGEYDGRPFYLNYDLENADPQTEKIGQRDFAALRRATGVLQPEESHELHFKRFGVKIGIKNRKDTGEPENVVRRYLWNEPSDIRRAA